MNAPKTVTLQVKRRDKRTGSERIDCRLFVMSEHQRRTWDEVVARLVLSGTCDRADAEHGVARVVAKLLGGTMPRDRDASIFHRLRLTFPILKPKQIEALPRAGCPDGWIEAANLVLLSKTTGRTRAVHLFFTPEQAVAYNDALVAIRELNNLTRDDAWTFLNRTIGALLCGLAFSPDAHEVLRDLAEHFPMVSDDFVDALPLATEDDLLRWSFTTTPEEGDAVT